MYDGFNDIRYIHESFIQDCDGKRACGRPLRTLHNARDLILSSPTR